MLFKLFACHLTLLSPVYFMSFGCGNNSAMTFVIKVILVVVKIVKWTQFGEVLATKTTWVGLGKDSGLC